MDILGKVAIVTGGASGLGEATVRRYIGAGAKVAIFDLNDERGKSIESELGSDVVYFNVNVTDEESVHCLLYTSPSPRDLSTSRMPSSA